VALTEYLRAKPLELPWEMSAEGASEDGMGTVTPSFERGDLFLVDEEGTAFRLSWTGDEKDGERKRALPAGKYALRTYRIVREKDGERWHVSATRPTIMSVEVKAGSNVEVEVDDSISISSRLNSGQAQMMIHGDKKAGLSIYRAGKRIPIGYRVLGDDGTVLASGNMRYG